MIDVALLAGRLLLLALLYLFLFAAVRAGIGLVSGQRTAVPGAFNLSVTQGPPALKGVAVPVIGPVVIGRSPGADIVIGDDFVSGRHARVTPAGSEAVLEDLGSTNGTLLNGQRVLGSQSLRPGDLIEIGAVKIKVNRA
ncbi:MAG: FHA domain-containing protein [Actinobacteria bacterium HGW-Actinobacteria-7]|nr:MAG: FHA domain-containing protein [Actinobacteria bacterium HGW-Actinobacteria-7]